MNENNLEYLKKTLEGLGFGTKLHDVLETAIRREMPKFSLGVNTRMRPAESRDFGDARTEVLDFRINFNRSKESDMYFLNDYRVTLRKKDDPIVREQTFDLARDHRITAYQAFKLLSGFSLEKEVFLRNKGEGQQQGAQPDKIPMWFRLNLDITDAYGNHPLRTFRPEYGYDLNEALGKYPIKGLDTPEKMQEAMIALRNGNYVHTTLAIGRKNVPVSIAANPQMKTIDIYDKDMAEIRDETIFPEKATTKKEEREAPSESVERKNGKKTEPLPWQQEPEQEAGRKRGR